MTGLLLLLALPSPAQAHGGFHESLGLGEAREDAPPDVATNYGLLTFDDGGEWAWICEEVVGPAGFSAWAEVGGRWFLGSFDGLQRSEDQCDWPFVGAPLDGLFVTWVGGDAVASDVVWVTTSSGAGGNALWRSDDRGDSFTAQATFGDDAALRGFTQDPSGLPWFVIGWAADKPRLWVSPDGKAWTEHLVDTDAVTTDDIYSVGLLGHAHGSAWARVADADSEHLVRMDADGTMVEVLDVDGALESFAAGDADGELYVGGRVVGLHYSADGGDSWAPPLTSPESGCLQDRGGQRYTCGHNWADGGSVLSTASRTGDPAGWSWDPVLRFGEVRHTLACPAGSEVATTCEPLWEIAASEAGFDQDLDTGDSGTPADTGTPKDDERCGGCAAGPAGGGVLVLLPLLLWGRSRRR